MKRLFRLIVPIIVVLMLILVTVAIAKKSVVGEGEVGVTSGFGGSITIYDPGKVPYAIPFIERYGIVSTMPKVVSFTDGESVKISSKEGESIFVESQVTYSITDVEKAVKTFGIEDTHQNIRNEIKRLLDIVVKDAIPDIKAIDNDKERPLLTATIHLNLNDLLKDKGVSVSGYQIRYK